MIVNKVILGSIGARLGTLPAATDHGHKVGNPMESIVESRFQFKRLGLNASRPVQKIGLAEKTAWGLYQWELA
jgi:hypothetical protein